MRQNSLINNLIKLFPAKAVGALFNKFLYFIILNKSSLCYKAGLVQMISNTGFTAECGCKKKAGRKKYEGLWRPCREDIGNSVTLGITKKKIWNLRGSVEEKFETLDHFWG